MCYLSYKMTSILESAGKRCVKLVYNYNSVCQLRQCQMVRLLFAMVLVFHRKGRKNICLYLYNSKRFYGHSAILNQLIFFLLLDARDTLNTVRGTKMKHIWKQMATLTGGVIRGKWRYTSTLSYPLH